MSNRVRDDALNDIHAQLTITSPVTPRWPPRADPGPDRAAPCGRRDIEITMTETAPGWPVGCAEAGDTSVFIRQGPQRPGLLIEICTKTHDERDGIASPSTAVEENRV